jgi:hypothetical protein
MSKIKDFLKDVLTKSNYDIWIEPITEHITKTGVSILEVPNIYYETKISEILKSQNLSAEIIIHEHQELKTVQQKPVETKPLLSATTLQMEKPYSK